MKSKSWSFVLHSLHHHMWQSHVPIQAYFRVSLLVCDKDMSSSPNSCSSCFLLVTWDRIHTHTHTHTLTHRLLCELLPTSSPALFCLRTRDGGMSHGTRLELPLKCKPMLQPAPRISSISSFESKRMRAPCHFLVTAATF